MSTFKLFHILISNKVGMDKTWQKKTRAYYIHLSMISTLAYEPTPTVNGYMLTVTSVN